MPVALPGSLPLGLRSAGPWVGAWMQVLTKFLNLMNLENGIAGPADALPLFSTMGHADP